MGGEARLELGTAPVQPRAVSEPDTGEPETHEPVTHEPSSPSAGEPSAGEPSAGEPSAGEPSGGTLVQRLLAYVRKNRMRLARIAILLVTVYAVADLVSSAPQDATLALSLSELRAEAAEIPEEIEVSILERGSDEVLTHSRTRLSDDRDTLRHAVHLWPGEYTVRVEGRGVTPREGHFEIPADGVVRVSLRPAP